MNLSPHPIRASHTRAARMIQSVSLLMTVHVHSRHSLTHSLTHPLTLFSVHYLFTLLLKKFLGRGQIIFALISKYYCSLVVLIIISITYTHFIQQKSKSTFPKSPKKIFKQQQKKKKLEKCTTFRKSNARKVLHYFSEKYFPKKYFYFFKK